MKMFVVCYRYKIDDGNFDENYVYFDTREEAEAEVLALLGIGYDYVLDAYTVEINK